MSGGRVFLAVSAVLPCLLAACGPHNALDAGQGGDDFRMAMVREKNGDTAAARGSERSRKEYPDAELAGLMRQKLPTLPQ